MSRFPRDRLGDSELVEAVARGDTAALGVVWDRYAQVVRSVLRSNLGVDAAVEDLLQEVFIAFFRGAATLRDASALRAYLVSVAVRLVFVELRRRRVRRWVTLSPRGQVPEMASEPSDLDGALALRGLYRLLEQLPPRRRVAFVLRQVQGLEIAEVAAALRTSESTAKREVSRARRAIVARAKRLEPSLWEFIRRVEEGTDG
ncbi:MAG TPA: RNA polymerase sigma factor [Polyangiaceae bacterium]|nr:RNA polymerase sigma factor [Polyangiaceae bacterium]